MTMSTGVMMTKCFCVRPVLASVALVFLAVGCAAPSTNLTVTSLKNRHTYQQRFSQAYAGRSEQGDFDVVLAKGAPNGGTRADVRQVMHVRVLWKPMKGAKLDHPTATNATVDWYVFSGSEREPGQGLVAYSGAAFVTVHKSGGLARLDVRNATLRPAVREGAMTDPLGPASLQGTIVARTGKAARVRELLAEARQATARANETRNAAAREASSRAPLEP